MINEIAAVRGTEVAGKAAGNSGQSSDQGNQNSGAGKKEELYTEAQLQAKIKEAQVKIRTGQATAISNIQKEIDALRTEKAALETQIEEQTVLKETIADLHGKLEEGISDDAKAEFNRWAKERSAIREERIRGSKDFKTMQEKLSKYEKSDREKMAETLSAESGVSKEELMTCLDETAMKAYAYDHRDTSVKAPEKVAEPEVVAEKMPPLEIPASQAGGPKTSFSKGEIDSMDVKTFAQHREAVLKALAGGKIKE